MLLAIPSNTFFTSSLCDDRTNGTPFLIMPPFSNAMDFKSFPNISVWSTVIGEIIVTFDFRTLVESNRPPRPVSTTATSTFSLLK